MLPTPAIEPCAGEWSHFLVTGTSATGITAIDSADDGRLLVGTRDGGLSHLVRREDGTYAWSTIPGDVRDPLASSRVTVLRRYEDEVWIGTADAGVSIWNLRTGEWRQMRHRAGSLGIPSNRINSLTIVPGESPPDVWFGTDAGAAFFEPGPRLSRWTILDADDGLQPSIRDIETYEVFGQRVAAIATLNNYYTYGSQGLNQIVNTGDCRFATANRIVRDVHGGLWFAALWRPLDTPALLPDGLCSWHFVIGASPWREYPEAVGIEGIPLLDLDIDDANRLWIAGRGVAAVRDAGSYCFWYADSSPLINDDLTSAHANGEATWFGARTSPMVARYTPNWRSTSAAELGVAGVNPSAVAASDGRVWVGVGSRLSNSADGVTWSSTDLPIGDADITGLHAIDDDTVWVATTDAGIVHVDGALTTLHTTDDGLPSNDVRDVSVGPDGRAWAVTVAGLAAQGGGYWLAVDASNSPLATNDLTSVAVDANGRVHVGTAASGLYSFDPSELEPNAAWTHVGAGPLLPSNAVHEVVADPTGGLWIGTDGGLTHLLDGASATWNVADGALPSDEVLAIALGGSGRVWVGTDRGLVLGESDAWRTFRLTSALSADRVVAIAEREESVWAAAGNAVAQRDPITGPIGFFPPEIHSIDPPEAAPGDWVTIRGANFDPRGEDFNVVTFGPRTAGQNELPAPAILDSVATNEIVLRLPVLATTGRVRVVARGLAGESPSDFVVLPHVTGLTSTCLSPGDVFSIEGFGFRSIPGAAYPRIRIGNGPLRTPFRASPYSTSYKLQPGDPGGRVSVTLENGRSSTSQESITIGTLSIRDVEVQQGIASEDLIWRKRTLVHVDVDAEGCQGRVTDGTIYWKKTDGELIRAGIAYLASPGGLALPLDQSATLGLADGIDFVAEFLSDRSDWVDPFPLAELDGVRIVLENNDVEILEHDIPASTFGFVDLGPPSLRFHIRMLRALDPDIATPTAEFWRRTLSGIEQAARMMPQPDTGLRFSSHRWFTFSNGLIPRQELDIDDTDAYIDFCESVGDFLDPDPNEIAIALVDDALYIENSTPARAPPYGPGSVGVAFCMDDRVGRFIVHEGGHGLDLVESSASNHDDGNDGHSLYDEGQGRGAGDDPPPCADWTELTFRQALLDQAGEASKVYRIDSGPPFLADGGFCDANRPKSVMSYAPGRTDMNTFLEPMDFSFTQGYIAALASVGFVAGSETLRLRGSAFADGRVEVRSSRLEVPGGEPSREDEDGAFRVVVFNGAGAIRSEHRFAVRFEDVEGHGDLPRVPFGICVLFPPGSERVEIRHAGVTRWSAEVSPNAPVAGAVSLDWSEAVGPRGGTPDGSMEIAVSWTASDADGDALTYGIDYSADGFEWTRVARGLRETSFSWVPGWVPASDEARVRVTVSDGFRTDTAESAPFELRSREPIIAIVRPLADETFTEGTRADFVARILADESLEIVHVTWTVSGRRSRRGTEVTHVLDTVGEHTVGARLTYRDGRRLRVVSDSVEVVIIPDFDRDGMPNDWEEEHGLNRFVLDDAVLDSDGDRLANLTEFKRGTDPDDPDSDDDGVLDGDEVELGYLPDDPSSFPEETEDPRFRRGDVNGSGEADISDAIAVLDALFLGGRLDCLSAADGNDSGQVDIADASFVLSWLFLGGRPPPAPGPHECGVDPTADELGCAVSQGC